MLYKRFIYFVLAISFFPMHAQTGTKVWHDTIRKLHYAPKGKSFVLQNGTRKFNRALYGTNTGFRVETGDLPEFALYMPGMGGNFKLGIISGGNSKWITEASLIETTYTPGLMEYKIEDPLLKNGNLQLQVLALADSEGLVLKVVPTAIPDDVQLVWVYGGASGKKFHRDGDIGADPESVFYLQPEYCEHNSFEFNEDSFSLDFGWDKKGNKTTKHLTGSFPASKVHLKSAHQLKNPLNLVQGDKDDAPLLAGTLKAIDEKALYWKIENTEKAFNNTQQNLAKDFEEAFKKANELASRVVVSTPDPYINTLGGSLATAADAIWEDPAYLHGSVAWRMHLNAWRGAYVADPLGWHDRAEKHFKSYGNSQVLEPETGPVVPDTSRYFARQKEEIGTSMFSEGYISRHPNNNTVAHHYDMNLVFIDQLLTHIQWTGDLKFLKEMWPVIKRHLAWEKRNYDTDGDGLYDAYAAIWASDALQYSGGGVAYTSAYNYRANTMAAKLAKIVGDNPEPYAQEAEKIYTAMQQKLWLPEKGVYAEYKDLLGNQLLHKNPGIWTIYHTIDKQAANPFEAYQSLQYINTNIPHIPVAAEGLAKDSLSLISTTNWQPYTWSVNNVGLAENLNTALAYWQRGDAENAYHLWESALIESMYLGASPGGFQQLSFYDAIRGELYRDFADPIGMAGRTLVEGLFGVHPDALKDTLTIQPGFPKDWKHASLKIPDLSFSMIREGKKDTYLITPTFPKNMKLRLKIKAPFDAVNEIEINGKKADYHFSTDEIGAAYLIIEDDFQPNYKIEISWKGKPFEELKYAKTMVASENISLKTATATILDVKDPQQVLANSAVKAHQLQGKLTDATGTKNFFIKLQQQKMQWWQPVNITVEPELELVHNNASTLTFLNHSATVLDGKLVVNQQEKSTQKVVFISGKKTTLPINSKFLVPGTTEVLFQSKNGQKFTFTFQNWDLKSKEKSTWKTVDLTPYFNSKVTNIFKNQYFSPRPQSPTLQLPTTGIGNWCYPTVADDIKIDDSGLQQKASKNGEIISPQGIPFRFSKKENQSNIVFTSQWDTYPKEVSIPLTGSASHAYLVMAGTTNPMQSRFVNGKVQISYQDGSTAILKLKNPENWWPIEQDYYTDGYAFTTDAPKPPRLYFKTGEIIRNFTNYSSVHGFYDYGTDGGAGTLVDLPLNPQKTLKNLTVKATANDVMIGLMSLTLKEE